MWATSPVCLRVSRPGTKCRDLGRSRCTGRAGHTHTSLSFFTVFAGLARVGRRPRDAWGHTGHTGGQGSGDRRLGAGGGDAGFAGRPGPEWAPCRPVPGTGPRPGRPARAAQRRLHSRAPPKRAPGKRGDGARGARATQAPPRASVPVTVASPVARGGLRFWFLLRPGASDAGIPTLSKRLPRWGAPA